MNVTPIPRSLIAKLPDKLSPSRILDGLGEAVICHHSFHIERLNADNLVFIYQLAAQFMKEISALIGYMLLLTSDCQACFLPSIAALLSAGKNALKMGRRFSAFRKN